MANPTTKSRILAVALVVLVVYLAYGYLDSHVGEGPVLTEPVAGVDRATVFYFYTDGCPACKQMKPTFDSVAAECGGTDVEFKKINAVKEGERELSKQFQVRAVPTTSLVGADGYEKNRHVGAFSKKRFLADLAELTGRACNAPM